NHPRGGWPDLVADLDLVQAAQPGDLAGRDGRPGCGAAALEHADRGDLALATAAFWTGAEPQAVAGADGAGEHPDVGELLAAGSTLDLEDAAGDRPAGIARPGR